MSDARLDRAFAVTRVICHGSNRGVTAALVTTYAFCSTRTPNAAGSSVTASLCSIAPDMPQHSRPRASSVPVRMNLLPCFTRSSKGPINGARIAYGAIVIKSARATRPRASPTEVLKNKLPASATATNASPMPLAAVSSSRVEKPVRFAPDAPVIRCTNPPAAPAAAALARPARCETS